MSLSHTSCGQRCFFVVRPRLRPTVRCRRPRLRPTVRVPLRPSQAVPLAHHRHQHPHPATGVPTATSSASGSFSASASSTRTLAESASGSSTSSASSTSTAAPLSSRTWNGPPHRRRGRALRPQLQLQVLQVLRQLRPVALPLPVAPPTTSAPPTASGSSSATLSSTRSLTNPATSTGTASTGSKSSSASKPVQPVHIQHHPPPRALAQAPLQPRRPRLPQASSSATATSSSSTSSSVSMSSLRRRPSATSTCHWLGPAPPSTCHSLCRALGVYASAGPIVQFGVGVNSRQIAQAEFLSSSPRFLLPQPSAAWPVAFRQATCWIASMNVRLCAWLRWHAVRCTLLRPLSSAGCGHGSDHVLCRPTPPQPARPSSRPRATQGWLVNVNVQPRGTDLSPAAITSNINDGFASSPMTHAAGAGLL